MPLTTSSALLKWKVTEKPGLHSGGVFCYGVDFMTAIAFRSAVFPLFLAAWVPVLAGPALRSNYSLPDAGMVRAFETVTEAEGVALYETGRGRTVPARRVVTPEVLVRLENVAQAAAVAAQCGASAWRAAPVLADAVIFTFPGTKGEALPAAELLRATPGVRSAEPLLARQQSRRWTPNDPFFAYNAANAGYQWHLKNTGQNGGTAGLDVNISGVWDAWRGSGIRIGIVDDGLQTAHPDLAPNCDTLNDYDWNGNDDDPSPTSSDPHGTCCAGVAAGRGNNGVGICGTAPEATLVGMRLIALLSTDATEAAAFSHRNDIIQVKSNSWGPDDGGAETGGPGTLSAMALAAAAANGRGGRGTIFVWAGGNGLASGDDSNYDGYANSIYTIAVSAVTDGGVQAYFSEPGSNMLITAPSRGGAQGISTVDLVGSSGYNFGGGIDFASPDYTNNFGGTSAACPVAAGVVALLLQSQPTLGWRDVKEILIRSATKNHDADAGWFNNAAGFDFNDKYGAGLINAGAAIALGTGWSNLAPMVSQTVNSAGFIPIPDNSVAGAVKTFTFTAAPVARVEQIALSLNITHSRRGQMQVELTSPSGTLCKLARPRPDARNNLSWTFTSPQFWGETGQGVWTLRVKDTVSLRTGTLDSASLTLYGTASPPVDVDGDGFTSEDEAWFGTSDANAAATPAPSITWPGGIGRVTFPSVPGNAYIVECSTDLLVWAPTTVTATAASTSWDDPAGATPQRRYYKIHKP